MNDDLERELRNALRPKQPSRDLMPVLPAKRHARAWWTAPIAAVLLVSAATPVYRIHQQRKAKDQLVFALKLTALKLDRAKTRVHTLEMEANQ